MHRVQGNPNTPTIECVNPVKNKWRIRWDYQQREDGTTDYMEAEFSHKPSQDEIRQMVTAWYNDIIDQQIRSGFTFEDNTVWLSQENQFNYKAVYDLAVQTNGQSLPVTVKLGTDQKPVYRTFSTLDEFHNFYTAALAYIQQTLADGWKMKDQFNIEDYSIS